MSRPSGGLIAAAALSLSCISPSAWPETRHDGDHHPHPHHQTHPHPSGGKHDHGGDHGSGGNHDHSGDHDHGGDSHRDHPGHDPRGGGQRHDANGFGPHGHATPADRPGRGGWVDPHHGDRFDPRIGHGRYRVGERLPWNYRLVGFDWRGRGLWSPPGGFYWAQVDNDFVLAALATGAIATVIPDNVPLPPRPGYFPPPSAPPSVPTGAQIVARSGACLDVQRGDTQNGTPLILFRCHFTPNQSWAITGDHIVGDGGSCIDVQGNQAILSSCNGSDSQRWALQNGGIVGIGGQCLGGLNGGGGDRTPVVLQSCTGAAWQQWSVQ